MRVASPGLVQRSGDQAVSRGQDAATLRRRELRIGWPPHVLEASLPPEPVNQIRGKKPRRVIVNPPEQCEETGGYLVWSIGPVAALLCDQVGFPCIQDGPAQSGQRQLCLGKLGTVHEPQEVTDCGRDRVNGPRYLWRDLEPLVGELNG